MGTKVIPQNDPKAVVLSDQTENRAVLSLEGMTCASCARRIEKGLGKLPGVKDANVNFATDQATVTYNPSQTDLEQMVQKIDTIGYKAIPLVTPGPKPGSAEPEAEAQVTLNLEGMTCASCAMRIEKGLQKVPGVNTASVNFAAEQAVVTYDKAQTTVEHLLQKVEALGYKATPHIPPTQPGTSANSSLGDGPSLGIAREDEQSKRRRRELTRKRTLLMLGIVLTVPVVILSMFFMNRFPGENALLLVLTTPIWAIIGWEFSPWSPENVAPWQRQHGHLDFAWLDGSLWHERGGNLLSTRCRFGHLLRYSCFDCHLDLPGKISRGSCQRTDQRGN